MINIRINPHAIDPTLKFIDIQMPEIPKVGDSIGFSLEKKWHIDKVANRVFELDEDNNFLRVEVNLHGYSR